MDWPMQRRVERQARRMHDMMRRLDVDPVKLACRNGGDDYVRARTLCLFCGTSDKCLRWLDCAAPLRKRPDFCPNLPLFEACRRSKADVRE